MKHFAIQIGVTKQQINFLNERPPIGNGLRALACLLSKNYMIQGQNKLWTSRVVEQLADLLLSKFADQVAPHDALTLVQLMRGILYVEDKDMERHLGGDRDLGAQLSMCVFVCVCVRVCDECLVNM